MVLQRADVVQDPPGIAHGDPASRQPVRCWDDKKPKDVRRGSLELPYYQAGMPRLRAMSVALLAGLAQHERDLLGGRAVSAQVSGGAGITSVVDSLRSS
jgi:hypothetical protein